MEGFESVSVDGIHIATTNQESHLVNHPMIYECVDIASQNEEISVQIQMNNGFVVKTKVIFTYT